MINKMVQKYLGRKGYVAVKKSTIDYATSVINVAVRETQMNYGGNVYVKSKLISDLLVAECRLKYYRLE